MSPDDYRISGLRQRILACLLLGLLVGSYAALSGSGEATAQSPTIQVTSVNADSWPAIDVAVTVADAPGQPITGLHADAFSATLATKDVEVIGLQTTSDPGIGVAVVLAFDVSGSMAGAPLANAQAAGRALISQFGPSDQVSIVAFADQPVVVQPFTADTNALFAAIDGLTAGGNTSLYAGVEESVRVAATAALPRRAVVLLSDGTNFGVATTDPGPSLSAVSESSVLFISIGLGEAIDQAYLSQLATLGRGQFKAAPAPEDLTTLYQEAANVLRQQYVLSLDAGSLDPQVAHGGILLIQATTAAGPLAGEALISLPESVLATPVAPVVTTAPDEVEVRQPVPQATAESEGGSSSLMYLLLAAAAAASVAVCGMVFWRRRTAVVAAAVAEDGGHSLERFERGGGAVSFPSIQRAAANEAPTAWLEVPPDRQIALGDSPITVGFSSDCLVVLSNGSSSRPERARIWRRDGNYMLHNLSRVGGVAISGRPVTWAVLEDGDKIDIGGCTLLFRDTLASDISEI